MTMPATPIMGGFRGLSCDVLVVGAGPAGLAAALAAAGAGRRVMMIDDNPHVGGQIWRDGPAGGLPLAARRLRARLAEMGNVIFLGGTRIFGAAGRGRLLFEDERGGGEIACQAVILCTGARELLLPFPGWTLPGVTGAGGLQAMIKGGLFLDGKRVLVAGSGPLLFSVAHGVRKAGGRLLGIAEQAPLSRLGGFSLGLWRWPGKVAQAVRLFDHRFFPASHVVEAMGGEQLEAVRLRRGGREIVLPCDRLACGFGLVANTELGAHLGCRLDDGRLAVDGWQATSQEGIYAAGECTGVGGAELALCEGGIAGLAASGKTGGAMDLLARRDHWRRFANRLARSFALDPALKNLARPDTVFCRCEDVPFAAVADESEWSGAKLHSRSGMGACQGKVCGAAASHLFGWTAPVPRMPVTPVRIQTLLGGGLDAGDQVSSDIRAG